VDEHQWGLRSAPSAEERRKWGAWVRSAEFNIEVLVGSEECPSWPEEHGLT